MGHLSEYVGNSIGFCIALEFSPKLEVSVNYLEYM